MPRARFSAAGKSTQTGATVIASPVSIAVNLPASRASIAPFLSPLIMPSHVSSPLYLIFSFIVLNIFGPGAPLTPLEGPPCWSRDRQNLWDELRTTPCRFILP